MAMLKHKTHQQPQTWAPPADAPAPPPQQADPRLIGYREQLVAEQPVKHRRRVFWWFFAAVQVLFIVWVITGGVSASNQATDAGRAGGTIGVGLIVLVWALVDIILGITYAVYRLATREK